MLDYGLGNPFLGPRDPPAGGITPNFICWICVTRSLIRDPRRQDGTFTGPYVTNCIFGLKTVPLAYSLTIGKLSLSFLDLSVPSFGSSAEASGWPDVRKSGGCESVDPFGFQLEAVDSVDSEHVVTSRASPVFPLGWRRVRWLKRRGGVACFTGLVP